MGILFPYNSPLFRGPSTAGGAPKPNLPLGTGTPPFFSNLAILSRKAPFDSPEPPLLEVMLGVGEVAREEEALSAFLCSRAAMRSFKFVAGY